MARDCLFFKASRLSTEGTQASRSRKARGSFSGVKSVRSVKWNTCLHECRGGEFTELSTRPLLLHGVVLNAARVRMSIRYALPGNVFFFLYPNFVMPAFCCVLVRHRISHRYEIVRKVTVVMQYLGYLSTEVTIICCLCPHPVGIR